MKNHSDSKSETRKLKGLTNKINNDCMMEEAINSAGLSETESRVMVSHVPMTHPLSESETCDFCKRVDKSFKESEFYSVSEWIKLGRERGYEAYIKQQWRDDLLKEIDKITPETRDTDLEIGYIQGLLDAQAIITLL